MTNQVTPDSAIEAVALQGVVQGPRETNLHIAWVEGCTEYDWAELPPALQAKILDAVEMFVRFDTENSAGRGIPFHR